MKKFFKTAFLCILIVCTAVTALVTEAAGITFTVKANKTDVKQGERVTITVENTAISSVIAVSATLNYDAGKFTVVSQTCKNNSFEGAYVSAGTSGQVKFVWDSNKNAGIGAGEMMSVTLAATDNAAIGSSEVSLTINSIFNKSGSGYISKVYEISSPVKIEIQQNSTSSKVSEVIAIIDAIGAVDTSDVCFDRITAAMNAFGGLTASEQSAVTNYKVLEEAYNRYYYLKNKELDDANTAKLEKEIADFRENYKDLLNLSEDSVSISHKVLVLAALNEYELSTEYIRSKLKDEAEHLKKLKSKIEELTDDLTLQEESEIEVKEYRETFKTLINTPVSHVVLNEQLKAQIDVAKSTYAMLNKYSKQKLKEDYDKILELAKRYEELEIINEPESEYIIKLANEYTDKYLTLLSKSNSDLTSDDAALISSALEDFKSLPNAARGKLLTQFEKLMSMQAYLNTEPAEESRVEYIDGDDGKSTVQYVYINGEKTDIKDSDEQKTKALKYTLDSGGMKNNTVYMVILLAVSMLTAVGSVLLYIWLKRKGEINNVENCNYE